MKIIETTKDKIVAPSRIRKPNGTIGMILDEFLDSNMEAAEVFINSGEYKDSYSACGVLKYFIKRNNLGCISTTRNGHIYLIRK